MAVVLELTAQKKCWVVQKSSTGMCQSL